MGVTTLTAPAPDPDDRETYDAAELDQLIGSTLWVGRLHNSLASFLDVTYNPQDTGLVEYLNLVPVEMTGNLLSTTDLLLAEVIKRSEEIRVAVSAALDSAAQRAITEGTKPDEGEFAEIIDLAFYRDQKNAE